jgi:hypothetical protein
MQKHVLVALPAAMHTLKQWQKVGVGTIVNSLGTFKNRREIRNDPNRNSIVPFSYSIIATSLHLKYLEL